MSDITPTPAEQILVPGDPEMRMEAYYYSFEPTGVAIIDEILSAVAIAGKHLHSTEDWADAEYSWQDMSEEQRIQSAADRAAAKLRAVLGES